MHTLRHRFILDKFLLICTLYVYCRCWFPWINCAQKHLRFWFIWLWKEKQSCKLPRQSSLLTSSLTLLSPLFPAAPLPNPELWVCTTSPHPHLGVKCIYIQRAERLRNRERERRKWHKQSTGKGASFWCLRRTIFLSIKPGQWEAVSSYGPVLELCGEYLNWTAMPLWATWESESKAVKGNVSPSWEVALWRWGSTL